MSIIIWEKLNQNTILNNIHYYITKLNNQLKWFDLKNTCCIHLKNIFDDNLKNEYFKKYDDNYLLNKNDKKNKIYYNKCLINLIIEFNNQ